MNNNLKFNHTRKGSPPRIRFNARGSPPNL